MLNRALKSFESRRPAVASLLMSLTVLLAAAFSSGCGPGEIKVYHVPKEAPPPTMPAKLPDGHPDLAATATTPALTWKTPAGWQEAAPSAMRVASFTVAGPNGKQADVSVIPLAGSAGGDLSNVNRWRGQVGQPPVSPEELKALAQSVEVAGQPATLYEQEGPDTAGAPTRILAVIQRRDGASWFFKMTGDSALAAQEKPHFVEFLKSVQFVPGVKR